MSEQERDAIRLRHAMRDMDSIERHMDLLIGNEKWSDALQFLQSEIDRRLSFRKIRHENHKKNAYRENDDVDVDDDGNYMHRLVLSYLYLQLGKFHENFTHEWNLAERAYVRALLNPMMMMDESSDAMLNHGGNLTIRDILASLLPVSSHDDDDDVDAEVKKSSFGSEVYGMQRQQTGLILFSLANLLYKRLNDLDEQVHLLKMEHDELLADHLYLETGAEAEHDTSDGGGDASEQERARWVIERLDSEIEQKEVLFNELYGNTITLLRQCMAMEPEMSEMRHKLAKVLLEYGTEAEDEAEAEVLLDTCINQHYIPSFSLLAQLRFDQDRKTEAMQLIDRAIEHQSNKNKKRDEAMMMMDEEYVSLLDHYRIKLKYAQEMGQVELVEQVCEYIVQNLDQNDLHVHIELARAREQLQKYDVAIRDLMSLYNRIKHARGSSWISSGERTEEETSTETKERVDNRHLIQFMLATLYDRMDQPNKSEYLLRDLLERLPREEYYTALARSLARQNKKEEARALLDDALTKHPEFRNAIRQFYPSIESVPIVPLSSDTVSQSQQ